jgi:XTP/dITP diphosphohydrolase
LEKRTNLLLLATSNSGKIAEIQSLLSDLDLQFSGASEFPHIESPEETGSTFSENAHLKAEYYFRKTGFPALADDSGLVVDALDGAPGVQSARYASTDELRIKKLLAELDDLNAPEPRTARFVCAICLFGPDGPLEVEGIVEGRILREPRGSGGFGYDPIFLYPPAGKSFAELSRAEKNRVSHRANALVKLRDRLRRLRIREL